MIRRNYFPVDSRTRHDQPDCTPDTGPGYTLTCHSRSIVNEHEKSFIFNAFIIGI